MSKPFDARELGTALAALRLWQDHKFDYLSTDLDEIATDGGTVAPLSREEIDALCERLNVAEPEQTVWVFEAEHGVVPGLWFDVYATPELAHARAAEAVNNMLEYCRETYELEGEEWLSDAMPGNWNARFQVIADNAEALTGELSDDWQDAYVVVRKSTVVR